MEEALPTSLILFSRPPTLLSINEFTYEQITTKTALDGDTPQLEFTVPPDKVNYTNLNDSYLYIKCKYTKADGSAIDAEPTVGCVNYLLTSLFKSIDLYINDQKVTPNEGNMAYINFLHAFSQTNAAKESYLTCGLYYEDTLTSETIANQSNPQAAANTNSGLKKRANFFGGSKEVQLLGKIYIPPHNTSKYYLPHLKFDYIFQMAPFEFFTMSGDAAGTYKFYITEAKLLIKRVTVSPAVQVAHEQLLQKQNCLYPCKYIESRTYNIPANSWSFIWENVFVGREMPVALLVVFVRTEA